MRISLAAVRISVGAVRTWYTFLQYVQPFRGLAANKEHFNGRTEHIAKRWVKTGILNLVRFFNT